MSWEGYYQAICTKGHYFTENAEYRMIEDVRCPICKSKVAWHNTVDTTNGSYDDEGKRIDGYVELQPYKTIQCKCCQTVLSTFYKIPKRRKHAK